MGAVTFAPETGAYGIQSVHPDTPGALVCGDPTCKRAWVDDITPAGRCPWEYDHDEMETAHNPEYVPGYSVTIRHDRRTGEYMALISRAYRNVHGERYYCAFTLLDGWVELSPEYVRECTRTVTTYPANLKRSVDRNLGRILYIAPRLY